MQALADVVCEISTLNLKSNFTFILTQNTSILFAIHTPDFEKILLKSTRRTGHSLEAVPQVNYEISTLKLKLNLAFPVTLSISVPFLLRTLVFEKILLKSGRIITHDLEALAVVVCEISTGKLKSNLAFFLPLGISKAFSVQTPVFEKMFLNSRRRITHDWEAVAVVVREISTGQLKSNLAFFLPLGISKAFSVQTPVFEKMFLNSRRRITHDWEAVAVVVREISTGQLKSNLAFFLPLSISKAFSVQTPLFEKIFLNSRRRITHGWEAVAVVVRQISTGKLK